MMCVNKSSSTALCQFVMLFLAAFSPIPSDCYKIMSPQRLSDIQGPFNWPSHPIALYSGQEDTTLFIPEGFHSQDEPLDTSNPIAEEEEEEQEEQQEESLEREADADLHKEAKRVMSFNTGNFDPAESKRLMSFNTGSKRLMSFNTKSKDSWSPTASGNSPVKRMLNFRTRSWGPQLSELRSTIEQQDHHQDRKRLMSFNTK